MSGVSILGPDQVGQPQHGDRRRRGGGGRSRGRSPRPRRTSLPKPERGIAPRRHLLGEHRRVPRSRSRRPWSTTSRPAVRTPGAFWHAASSCMVPMTLISFIDDRPPALPGVAMTLEVDDGVDVLGGDHLGDHRVADVGADERARAEVARAAGRRRRRSPGRSPGSPRAGAREPAAEVARDPGDERRQRPMRRSPSGAPAAATCRAAALDARLLQQLAVLLLRHPLAALLDD